MDLFAGLAGYATSGVLQASRHFRAIAVPPLRLDVELAPLSQADSKSSVTSGAAGPQVAKKLLGLYLTGPTRPNLAGSLAGNLTSQADVLDSPWRVGSRAT